MTCPLLYCVQHRLLRSHPRLFPSFFWGVFISVIQAVTLAGDNKRAQLSVISRDEGLEGVSGRAGESRPWAILDGGVSEDEHTNTYKLLLIPRGMSRGARNDIRADEWRGTLTFILLKTHFSINKGHWITNEIITRLANWPELSQHQFDYRIKSSIMQHEAKTAIHFASQVWGFANFH